MSVDLTEVLTKLDKLYSPLWVNILKNSIGAIIVGTVSVLTIIFSNSHKRNENEKNRDHEITKLKEELKDKRQETLISKYDSIILEFKDYKTRFSIFSNQVLTTLDSFINNYDNKDERLESLRLLHSEFVGSHTELITSIGIDISLLQLEDYKAVLGDIEDLVNQLLDIPPRIRNSNDLKALNDEYRTNMNSAFENMYSFIHSFSNHYMDSILVT